MKVTKKWASKAPTRVLEDVTVFLIVQAAQLIRLMFAALAGRYVVALFQQAKHNSGYVLFIVTSAVVLLKLGDHAISHSDNDGKPEHVTQ